MTNTLTGKVALVTGGSRGIGAAIVRRLAREGADVALTYASAQAKADEVVGAIAADGRRGVAIRADSADAAGLQQAVTQTVEQLGRLDILVSNAGIVVVKPVADFSLEEFDRMLAINVRAVFVGAQAAARHMGQGGRIITIGSINAERMPFVGGSVYAMTKAAIVGLTKGLARDLGPRGITVNNVQPGPVDTDLNPATGAFADSLRSLLAINRYGTTDEVASFVAFLAGPEAAYITGASLSIDGGFTA
ncbi:MAG: 3-oxoacyl-ACP reductase family protein [Candidatus Binatia bacterium]